MSLFGGEECVSSGVAPKRASGRATPDNRSTLSFVSEAGVIYAWNRSDNRPSGRG